MPVGIVTSWTPAVPDGADSPSNGDDVIRDLKVAIANRMRQGGHEWEFPSSGSLATAGRHKCFDSGDTTDIIDATMLAGEFYLWDSAGTAKLLTLGDSTAVNASKLTLAATLTFVANGGITSTGPITTTGTLTPTTLHVLGNSDLDGTLNVDGATTLKATDIGTGGGALTVNSLGTFAGGLVSSGATTFNGNVSYNTVTTTITYAVQTGDSVVLCNLSGNIDVTLPNAATQAKRVITVAIISAPSANQATVKSAGGTVDGAAAATGAALRRSTSFATAATFVSDGTNWWMISSRFFGS